MKETAAYMCVGVSQLDQAFERLMVRSVAYSLYSDAGM